MSGCASIYCRSHTVNRVQNYVTYRVPMVSDTEYSYNGETLTFTSEIYPFLIRQVRSAEVPFARKFTPRLEVTYINVSARKVWDCTLSMKTD